MILCLDVGNTQIFGGVFDNDQIKTCFRYETKQGGTSDQLGIFLKSVLRENNVDADKIEQVAICSVVPSLDYSLRSACIKYFKLEPFFLEAGVKTGIHVKSNDPAKVGADLIAGAISAVHSYPKENLIVIDFGTATTFAAISSKKEFLGASFLPGIRLSMNALQSNAAQLNVVEILKPKHAVGRSTAECIQSGLYYGHIGVIREMVERMTQEVFADKPPVVIGTGGFVNLFESENVFTAVLPNLILEGLFLALKMN
jgi:type III pantothenate kinase